jgi:hypothetical protein
MEEKPPAKKRGRPRKKEKKTERCTVWLAPETKRKLTSEAAHLGIRLSTYAGVRLSREREVYMAEAASDYIKPTPASSESLRP